MNGLYSSFAELVIPLFLSSDCRLPSLHDIHISHLLCFMHRPGGLYLSPQGYKTINLSPQAALHHCIPTVYTGAE